MHVVDTNLLVYAANRSCAEHERCRTLLEEWRQGLLPWYTTWSVIYEFLRVSTHPRVFSQPLGIMDAWGFVRSLLESPGLTVLGPTESHRDVAERTLEEVPGLRGNLLHDTHTAVLMREHGVKTIYTRDADFHRFPFLQVIDPLTAD